MEGSVKYQRKIWLLYLSIMDLIKKSKKLTEKIPFKGNYHQFYNS